MPIDGSQKNVTTVFKVVKIKIGQADRWLGSILMNYIGHFVYYIFIYF